VVRLGYYIPWAAGGAALAAVTIGLLSTWDAQSSKAQLLGYQALFFSRGLSIQMVSKFSSLGMERTEDNSEAH
jgi:hypothetical protein